MSEKHSRALEEESVYWEKEKEEMMRDSLKGREVFVTGV